MLVIKGRPARRGITRRIIVMGLAKARTAVTGRIKRLEDKTVIA
jgi:hypothetical protein